MKAIARPYTQDESTALKKEFLDIYKQTHGATVITCRQMKIACSTFIYWKENDEEFKRECEEIKELVKDHMEYSLVRDALKKGGTDRIFYMKTQMKDRGYTEDKYIDRDRDLGSLKTVLEYKINGCDEDLKARIIAEYEASKLLEQKPE